MILRRAILLLSWLSVFGAPAAAQGSLEPGGRPLRHGYLGATRCVEGVPTTTIDPHLDPRTRIEVAAHEAAHRRQLAGDCEARLRAAQVDPGIRLDREAEAYCAGLSALGLDEMRYGVAVERLRQALYDVFDQRPAIEVDARIASYCRGPSPGGPAR